MDVFSSLPARTRFAILGISLALFSFSMGALVFGENIISQESAMIEHAKDAARADLLYSQPHTGH